MQNQIRERQLKKITGIYLEKRWLQRCPDKNLNAAKMNIYGPIMLTLHLKVGSENIIAPFKYLIGCYIHNRWHIILASGNQIKWKQKNIGLVPYKENLSQVSET